MSGAKWELVALLQASNDLAERPKGELIAEIRDLRNKNAIANGALEALTAELDRLRQVSGSWHLLADMREDHIELLNERLRVAEARIRVLEAGQPALLKPQA